MSGKNIIGGIMLGLGTITIISMVFVQLDYNIVETLTIFGLAIGLTALIGGGISLLLS